MKSLTGKSYLIVAILALLTILSCNCVAFGEQKFEQIVEFNVPEANQGVGVDALYFYALDNRTIAKYDKTTGQLVTKWEGPKGGPIIHFDAATLQHIDSHSFGIHWGSYSGAPTKLVYSHF